MLVLPPRSEHLTLFKSVRSIRKSLQGNAGCLLTAGQQEHHTKVTIAQTHSA